MLKTYYLLTKPGIIMGNAITTASAFFLASKGHVDFILFLATVAGLGGIIGSACVCNNYIDRESDAKMVRTKNRPLPKGLISGKKALIFAAMLGSAGALVLGIFTNVLALTVALFGFFIYVVLYSFWKYKTYYATLVGSIAGAVPPVVGYCAVSHHLDFGAVLLFAILVLWQMPHFFAIAMYRFNDYVAASIPLLPIKKGAQATKIQMLLYIMGFTLVALLLTPLGYTGKIVLVSAALLGFAWLILCLKGFKVANDRQWARKMFVLSLVIITIFSVTISIDAIL